MRRKIEEKLLTWKNKKNRMPLLIYGARQVGKTYTLTRFGEAQFDNTVYINLETNLSVASYFFDDISPKRLIRFLETTANEVITPGKTLIILDEIQSWALTSLICFCEMAPEYHIVAAGSLLGVTIHQEHYSFPVGKVESMTLYPLDFEEFLWAIGEERLSQEILSAFDNMTPLPKALHQKAIEFYRYYLIVGGMPASVQTFINSGKLVLIPTVQNEIVNNYVADMAKYATTSDTVKIRNCFNSIPAQLAKKNKKFQYKIIQRGGSAALFGKSIEWLALAGIVLKCQKIDHDTSPINVYTDLPSFKLYMCDVGLLVMKSGVPQQTVLTGESNVFMGSVAENYVAQALNSNGHALFYWTSEHSAQLGFVLQKGSEVIGIEVKKGTKVHSKSLSVFIKKYKPGYSICFSENNFSKTENVFSVPFYAAFCI